MCSVGCAKVLLIVCNTLFFVGGAILLSFGIAGVANPIGLGGFLSKVPGVTNMAIVVNIPDIILSCCVYMIVLGSVMLVFGFLGCVGACCLFKPLLFFYWLLLVAVIVAEVALIIYAAVNPSVTAEKVQKYMYNSLVNNYDTVTLGAANRTLTLPSNIIALSWVSMQFEVGCCGTYNSSDYRTFNWSNTFNVQGQTIQAAVPPSCCVQNSNKRIVPRNYDDFVDLPGCLRADNPDSYYSQGCYKACLDLALMYMYIPIIICSVVLVIEVFCLMAACYLWRVRVEKPIP